MNIRPSTGTVTVAFLALALLAQAVAAVGRAPCPMHGREAVAATRTIHQTAGDRALVVPQVGHADHARHHHPAVASDDHAAARHGSCCEGMSAMDCSIGGCAAGTGTLAAPPVAAVVPPIVYAVLKGPPEWLPPYLTPSATLFRPPIA